MRTTNRSIAAIVLIVALMMLLTVSMAWGAGYSPGRKGYVAGTGGYTSNGGNYIVKTAAGVTTATITAATGEITGTGPKNYISIPLDCTANATTYTGALIAIRAMTITKASVAFVTKPASSAGTITLALTNYDLSATTDDNLLSTATIDLEGLTAKTTSNLTLTATGADAVLGPGDFVYATIISNNADAVSGGGVLTLEYTLQ